MKRILVTDGDERAALAVTRSLGRDLEVHVVGLAPSSLAGASRWAHAEHVVTAPLVNPIGFARDIIALAQSLGIDGVIPISDASCHALLPERARLPDETLLLAPTETAYRRLSDKKKVAECAEQQGIPSPPGGYATTLEDALAISRTVGWPLIVKPVTSIVTDSSAQGPVRLAVRRADNAPDLERVWSELGGSGALVQKRVPGWGEGLFVLRSQGQTRAVFAHRRLREKPPEGGVSVLRESIAVDPDLLARLEVMLDQADFEGVAMAEFKTDGTSRWLMEFNVRFWGSLQLAIDAGVDFPRLLVDSMSVENSEATLAIAQTAGFQCGVRSRWLLGEVDHALALARGGTDAKGRSGWIQALRVMFLPAGPRSRWEVLRLSDPFPFWIELRRWLRLLRSSRHSH